MGQCCASQTEGAGTTDDLPMEVQDNSRIGNKRPSRTMVQSTGISSFGEPKRASTKRRQSSQKKQQHTESFISQ